MVDFDSILLVANLGPNSGVGFNLPVVVGVELGDGFDPPVIVGVELAMMNGDPGDWALEVFEIITKKV
eukprot:5284482-Ditylum_brightwellii.AAC.1